MMKVKEMIAVVEQHGWNLRRRGRPESIPEPTGPGVYVEVRPQAAAEKP
jgi:hypothetical protein